MFDQSSFSLTIEIYELRDSWDISNFFIRHKSYYNPLITQQNCIVHSCNVNIYIKVIWK